MADTWVRDDAVGVLTDGDPRSIARTVLGLIGNTPTIPYPGRANLYVKLEGFNPTGSIADRLLLDAVVEGSAIHVVGSGGICASAALLGVVLGLPVTFQCVDPSPLTLVAEAYGARPSGAQIATVHFNAAAALTKLVAEIRSEVPGVSAIVLASSSPLRCAVNGLDGVRLGWITPRKPGGDARDALARQGILIDSLSAACLEEIQAPALGTVVLVALAEGALDYAL